MGKPTKYEKYVIARLQVENQVAGECVEKLDHVHNFTVREETLIQQAARFGFKQALQWAKLHGYIKV